MALGYIARAVAAGLAKVGEPSLLAGGDCGRVHLERNVLLSAGDLDNADDAAVVRRDVATILAQYAPARGQLLEHPDGNFKLDRKLDFNGYAYRFIVVKVA